MKHKREAIIALVLIAIIASFSLGLYYGSDEANKQFYGSIGIDLETTSIHCRISMYQNGEKVFDEYHAGAVTNIGDNQTLAWIFGDADYNVTKYMNNATYISIGDQGSISTASTILPGEWNRTTATIEDETQSQLNMTCTFYPTAGPHTADCIGINWESSGDGSLWAYDTFSEVSSIDDTYTINVEFSISVSHS